MAFTCSSDHYHPLSIINVSKVDYEVFHNFTFFVSRFVCVLTRTKSGKITRFLLLNPTLHAIVKVLPQGKTTKNPLSMPIVIVNDRLIHYLAVFVIGMRRMSKNAIDEFVSCVLSICTSCSLKS